MSNFFSALDDSDDEAPTPTAAVNKKTESKKPSAVAEPSEPRPAPSKSNDHNTKYGGRGKNTGEIKHGKRTHDRKSGTGRGKEIRKGGGGARNWGSDKNDARRAEGVVVEGKEDANTLEEEAPTAGAAEAVMEDKVQKEEEVEEEAVEEEEKTLSYEEYMAQKARPENELFAPPKERKVDSEFANVQAKVAVEEDFLVMGGSTGKKKKSVRHVEKKTVDVGFRVTNPSAQSNNNEDRRSSNRRDGEGDRGSRSSGRGGDGDRREGGRGNRGDRRGGRGDRGGGRGGDRGGGRGGRGGGGRGGRGGGSGRGRSDQSKGGGRGGLDVNDSSAFPSL